MNRITQINPQSASMFNMPRHVYLTDDFGPRLKKLRLEQGWTQGQLAQEAHCSLRAILYYEKEGKFPPVPTLVELANAFDISIETLIGKDELLSKKTVHSPNLFDDIEDRKLWKKFQKQMRNIFCEM